MGEHNNLFFQTKVESELERKRQTERRNAEALAFDAAAYRSMPEDIRHRAREWGLEAFICGVWNNGFHRGYLQFGRDQAIGAAETIGERSEASHRIAELEAKVRRIETISRLPDVERRQVFISDLLKSRGWFNRSDITEEFSVSVPQSSKDIQRWLKINPGVATYNAHTKRYEADLAEMQKEFLAESTDG